MATLKQLSTLRSRLTEALEKDDLPGAARKELAAIRLATDLRLKIREKQPALGETRD
ncbi:hypothetical protein [Reyranella sp.]|jgi:hypothetical protein|uniref:hypothetical protein n=1 Tax=Reyranella sp. TaxID=1929291 RepID=UPI0026092E64|nr:hypothetical protein [Reyranella sp.]HQS14406.1 hypothetical protein [Reyranella sp.]HQT11403.1 hypothetical protein [Reyranella sp.]